ncbi:MAG: isoprenylcysteine carboxylmethyltransferase family protein [Candidatus Omnitrophica bacterium]|nr:isoprenylcysteine carboxylmethyltransferase family protein [Candidatus Omnitrophota bacterium]
MDLKPRLQRWFKPRFAVIYPFGVLVLLFGSCNDHSLGAGIGYIIAGLLIRLWSNGYAVKNDKLTTSGPYAFVRNPLYLGTFLIAIGFVIALNMSWMGIVFLLALTWVYYKTIQNEQGMLSDKFGDAYRAYAAKVHAMVPSLLPYPDGDKWPFSLQRLIDSKEHKPFFWVIILLIVFHLKSRLFLEHQPMTTKTWILAGLGVLLVLLDILYEMNKNKIHRK